MGSTSSWSQPPLPGRGEAEEGLAAGQRAARSPSCQADLPTRGHSSLQAPGEGCGEETPWRWVLSIPERARCAWATPGWGRTRPRSSKPHTSSPIRFPKCPQPLAPCGLCPEQRVDRDRPGASQRRNQSPPLPLPTGQQTERPGLLLSPAPGPDDTDTHTCTHTRCACVGLAVLTRTSQPERRLERQEAFKPQPAHSGHHSPRRRCYKTWCGVCGSGGRACASGTAPSLGTSDDGGNVKIHSSPLQRMGSALHTGTCHCHGAPGISSGRAGGRGCQRETGTLVRCELSSHGPGVCFWAKDVW